MSDTGYSVVPRWILKDERFTLHMVATYLALQSFSGREGMIFPSISKLAERARLGATATRAALRELEKVGVLVVTKRLNELGAQTSNTYTVLTVEPTNRGETAPSPHEAPPPQDEAPPSATRRPPLRQALPKEPHVSNPSEVVLLSPGEPDDQRGPSTTSNDEGDLLPQDWGPNQKHQDLAASLHLDVQREAYRFRDNAMRKNRRLKNWNAGFTNWLKQAAVFNQQRGQQGQPRYGNMTAHDRARERTRENLAVVERMRMRDEARQRGITQ